MARKPTKVVLDLNALEKLTGAPLKLERVGMKKHTFKVYGFGEELKH